MRGNWFLRAASAAILASIGLAGSASAQTAPSDPAGDSTTRARVTAGQTINGAVTAGDTDWYRITMRTGQLYRISLSGAEGASDALADPVLRVVNASGDELAANDDAHDTLNSYLEYSPSRSGDLFVEARGFGDDATGAYTLHVDAVRLPPDPASAALDTRGRLVLGQTLTASLDYAGDKDWYRIRLNQGQSYRFTLNAGQGEHGLADPAIRLMSADGTELAADDDGGDGLNSYLEFTAPATGNYFLEAHGFTDDAVGGYTLSAQAGDIPADTSTDASLSADGDSREGVLSPAGDHDWYRINLTEGQSMRVALDGGAGEGMLADPFLVLHGPDGAEIAHDDDGGEGLNSWMEFIAPSAGAYYVEAHGFGEDATGKYTLTLTAGEIPGVADGAEVLTPNSDGRASMIAPAGDQDWFAIQLIEGRPYRFNVRGGDADPLADPVLTIYNEEGKPVATDDDGGTGANAYLNFVSPTGGTYYAAVSGFNNEGVGHYVLNVTDTDVAGNTGTDEALAADDGDDRIGAIEIPGDLDMFGVQLTAGVSYVINLTGNGEHPLADPFLTVLNSEGTSITTDDDSGPGSDARLTFVPQNTDTFYLQASGLGGSTGGYTISIARRAAPSSH